MSLRKTAISGIKWTTAGTIGRSLFQLLQVSILTRFLPKEAFGLVAMALFVVQFSNIFVDMGMTSAILHRQNATKNEYSSIYWLNIFISLFLYGILFFSAPVIARFYNEPELRMLVPILGTNLLLMASGRQHRTIMQKQFQFKAIAITELSSFFLGLIAAIILAINNFGVYSLVYSTLLAAFISNSSFLIQNLRLNPIRLHFRLKETKPFLKIGGFTMGSTLLDFFSREIDVLIIGKMLGAESLGVYSLAKQIVRKLFSVINPIIITVLSPLLSSIQKEKERLKATYLKVIKYLAYINFPIYVLIIVASKEILQIVYGAAYAESYVILAFLAFAYCLAALSNPVGSLQIATGRTDIGFKWTILRVIVTPPVIFVGTLINIEAVAAFYASLSLLFVIPLWYILLKPLANIKLKEYLNQFYKPLLFFLGATLIIYLLGDKTEITNNVITNAIIKVSITVVAFAIFIFSFDKKSVLETYNLFISTIKRNK
ncbi:MAG: MOP flippase family protein [Bacteroidales bacterium]|nr:MOP flippase family protein [Bacteroidales bacterium]MDD4210298.1 MOP flippase family protein [Bacteroidales bacterium]